jgi:hypothetical protein
MTTFEDQRPGRADDQAGTPAERPEIPDGSNSGDLAGFVRRVLAEFIADPHRNTLGPGAEGPAWEDFLMGFASGDDPLWTI